MTGAFDRRVQELADSVAQGLQPSIQFVTPEFYVVKSAESIDNTTATFRISEGWMEIYALFVPMRSQR